MNTDQQQIHMLNYLKGTSLSMKSLFYKDDANFWNQIFSQSVINIDLTGINYISHDGAIWISYICMARKKHHKITYITLPINPDVIGYLKSINFRSIADGETVHFFNSSSYDFYPIKYTYAKKEEQNLAKLILINGQELSINPKEINLLLRDYLLNVVFPNYKSKNLGTLFDELFSTTISELIKNITDYGGDKLGDGKGYCSLIPAQRQDQHIRYCFFDVGKGFRETLLAKRNEQEFYKLGEINDDKTAIIKGLLFRQTIKAENIIGLYPVLGIICATRGKIGVRSGNAIVEIDFSQQSSNDMFKSNFFNMYKQTIDDNLNNYFNSIVYPNNCSYKIPGSQIYIDIGTNNIDTLFLQNIYDYLDSRS